MLNYLKLPNQTPKEYFHSQCFSKQTKIRDYKNATYVFQGCRKDDVCNCSSYILAILYMPSAIQPDTSGYLI